MKSLINQETETQKELERLNHQITALTSNRDALQAKLVIIREEKERDHKTTGRFQAWCERCEHSATFDRAEPQGGAWKIRCPHCESRNMNLTPNKALQPLARFWATARKGWDSKNPDRNLVEYIRYNGCLDEWAEIEGRFVRPKPTGRFRSIDEFIYQYLFAGIFDMRNDHLEALRKETLWPSFQLARQIAEKKWRP